MWNLLWLKSLCTGTFKLCVYDSNSKCSVGTETQLEYSTLYHFTCSNGDHIWLILGFAVNLSYNRINKK